MNTYRRKRFDAFLPSTPVTLDMRQQVEALGKRENLSLSEIQRAALEFFLSQSVNFSDKKDQKFKQL